jgi:hypothetical protein
VFGQLMRTYQAHTRIAKGTIGQFPSGLRSEPPLLVVRSYAICNFHHAITGERTGVARDAHDHGWHTGDNKCVDQFKREVARPTCS